MGICARGHNLAQARRFLSFPLLLPAAADTRNAKGGNVGGGCQGHQTLSFHLSPSHLSDLQALCVKLCSKPDFLSFTWLPAIRWQFWYLPSFPAHHLQEVGIILALLPQPIGTWEALGGRVFMDFFYCFGQKFPQIVRTRPDKHRWLLPKRHALL